MRAVLALIALSLMTACSASETKVARDAYLYSYPLMVTEMTRQSMNQPNNFIRHRRDFPDHTFKTVVRPNVDTLYSVAWFDVSTEPVILKAPKNDERYVLIPILDAWSNVIASIGSRQSENPNGLYMIVGPNWDGEVVEGATLYKSPTNMAWMIGRIYARGTDDIVKAHRYQDSLTVQTLSDYNMGKTPHALEGKDIKPGALPLERLRAMDAQDYFRQAAGLMQDNPPSGKDEPFLRYHNAYFSDAMPSAKVMEAGKHKAYKRLSFIEKLMNRKKGWIGMNGSRAIGQYGTDYNLRALVAHFGFGANEPIDAIYPRTEKDAKGRPLHGAYSYHMHFKEGQLPPVKGFWSLTAYNQDYYLIDTNTGKYAVSSGDALTYNDDGSLDLYIGHKRPERASDANWLPVADNESFNLTMRLYWPENIALNGDWEPPSVERIAH